MYHDLPASASFWLFLLAVDEDLAAEVRKKGCSCGGRLHAPTTLASRGVRPPSFPSTNASG